MTIPDTLAATVKRTEHLVCVGIGWIWNQNYVVRANLLVALCWLGVDALMMLLAIIGMHTDNDALPLAALPFRILLSACGTPWSATPSDFDGMRADLPFWSPNNLYYEVLRTRGTYINATLVGLVIGTWHWWRSRRQSQAHSLHPQRTAGANSPIFSISVLLAVFAMGVLQWTPYGRSTRLASAWEDVYRFRYFPAVTAPAPIDPRTAFPAAVKRLINSRGITEKRRLDLTQLAAAIENAVSVNTNDRISLGRAAREMSAALLCIASSGQSGYDGGLGMMLEKSINTSARAAAFQKFLKRARDDHPLPAGTGCRMTAMAPNPRVLHQSHRAPES